MKMETEVRAARAGSIVSVDVKEGDAVQVGDSLVTLG
jgi:oxaloacetate decarboxylase alpha subunit